LFVSVGLQVLVINAADGITQAHDQGGEQHSWHAAHEEGHTPADSSTHNGPHNKAQGTAEGRTEVEHREDHVAVPDRVEIGKHWWHDCHVGSLSDPDQGTEYEQLAESLGNTCKRGRP